MPQTKPWSLRQRLTATSLAATLAVWLGGGAVIYALAVHENAEVADAAIIEAGELLLSFAQHEYAETRSVIVRPEELPRSDSHPDDPHLHYQVWNQDQRLLLRSHHTPEQALWPQREDGIGDVDLQGQRWRVYATSSSDRTLQIQIGEPYTHRDEIGRRTLIALLAVMLTGATVLLLLLSSVIRRSSAELGQSAQEIGRRSANDLSPLPTQMLPGEFTPLIEALNALLVRLSAALATERRFTADASHELRTPLAAIKAQAQLAARARTREAANEALRKLDRGIDRATHLTEQLLASARIDAISAQTPPSEMDLSTEFADLIETYGDLIRDKQLRVEAGAETGPILGAAPLLRMLLRNLVDNALRYTPAQGRVQIHARMDDGALQISVADDGPGIAAEDRERVFDRFYRAPGTEGTGSGLGLAIVRDIVQALGGSVQLGEGLDGRGLRVSVRLPRR